MRTGAAVGALLLAGCSLAPAPLHPNLPTPEAYPIAQPAAPSVARIGWRDFFADPELQDLFGRLRSLRAAALERYLASAEARRGLAASLIAQVVAGYLADRD